MASQARLAVGVDIGGTGIKAGIVDLEQGALTSDRIKVATPAGAEPPDVLAAVREVLTKLDVADCTIPLGVAFPAIVKNGRTLSAANVSDEVDRIRGREVLRERTGSRHPLRQRRGCRGRRRGPVRRREGPARPHDTDDARHRNRVGAAVQRRADPQRRTRSRAARGAHARDAEAYTAYSAMERDDLSWEQWAERLQWYYTYIEFLFSPDLFVVGGGVSKHADKFLPLLDAQDADRSCRASQQRRDHRGRRARTRLRRVSAGQREGGVRRGRMGRPVRRVLSGGVSPVDGHLSRRHVAVPLQRSTRDSAGRVNIPCLALLRARFAVRVASPRPRWSLTPPFHPYRADPATSAGTGAAVCSLWHCLADHSGWVLPTALPCGARTFLGAGRTPRRDRPADPFAAPSLSAAPVCLARRQTFRADSRDAHVEREVDREVAEEQPRGGCRGIHALPVRPVSAYAAGACTMTSS